MKDLIIKLLLMWIVVYLATVIVPGVEVSSFWMAIVVAVLLALVNMTVWSVLRFVSLPINILTLGIVWFLITILVIAIVDALVGGFDAGGFLNMALFAIVLALLQMLFGVTTKKL